MQIKLSVRFLLCGVLLFPILTWAQTRNINLDVNDVRGPFNTAFKTSIGAGRANEGLRADWQQQLAEIKRDTDFRYIRMHSLLTDDMGVYKVDAQAANNTIFNMWMHSTIIFSVSA